MNKTIKTLLITTAISFSASACSHFHGKTDAKVAPVVAATATTSPIADAVDKAVECPVMKSLENAKISADATVKELDNALANTKGGKKKAKIKKLVKEADKLSDNIRKARKSCDVTKHEKSNALVKKKHHHKKKRAKVVKTAAPVAPAVEATETK